MSKSDQMKKIEEEVFSFSTSPLFVYRNENNYSPVIGEGNCDADIVFIGEAPGKNEAKTGKPFCGAAGKILDELLSSVKIDRKDVYITNIVKDRPPENRDPSPREIEVYGSYLDRQIEIIKPTAIVTLGRYAMTYIMKKFDLDQEIETIGKAHGKVYKALASYGQVDIVTLYHPCMAIYKRSTLDMLKEDFKILKKYEKKGE